MSPNYELEGKTVRGRAHHIQLDERRKATISGVAEVESFNDQEVIMALDDCTLSLLGEQLHISKLNLDEGQLVVEGNIFSLDYSDTETRSSGGGLFSRMYR
jgi:sporulation protein YabP